MASWDNIELGSDSGTFFKMDPDKNYQLAFLGQPMVVQKDWGDGPKPRVHSNVVETSEPDKALIFDMPVSVARQVKEIFELSESTEVLVKIRKSGSGLTTKYTVVAGAQIKADTLKKLQALELHELGQAPTKASATDDDAPF